jgi:hypothetical protein
MYNPVPVTLNNSPTFADAGSVAPDVIPELVFEDDPEI